jgi:hypothetical protein
MGNTQVGFSRVVETIYNLPIEEKIELKTLLEHNIAETRRNEMVDSFKKAQAEHKEGALQFSSNVEDLKKML